MYQLSERVDILSTLHYNFNLLTLKIHNSPTKNRVMAGYTKLFGSILESTIWQEAAHIRLVWITMLALVDRTGVVNASVPGLAHRAGVSLKEVEEALEKFMEPDPYSRSSENEGRRIERVDGGWLILNYAKYRAKYSEEDRREYKRVKQAEYRARKGPSTAIERLKDKSETPEELARLEELQAGLRPGMLGGYGPEAQEAVGGRGMDGEIPDPDSMVPYSKDGGQFPEV